MAGVGGREHAQLRPGMRGCADADARMRAAPLPAWAEAAERVRRCEPHVVVVAQCRGPRLRGQGIHLSRAMLGSQRRHQHPFELQPL